MEKFGLAKYVQEYVYQIKEDKKLKIKNVQKTKNITDHLSFAKDYTIDTISRIWIYIIIGVGIGAIIHGFVPKEIFIEYAGKDNLFAVPIAVFLGIPLYTDAVGSIPIMQVLFEKGMPIGTILALMMSIVAISFPEMILLKKVLKVPLIAYFTLFLATAFIIIGYTYNIIF